jgi:crotonobetainyl-CoA:carnitine CoA-transferase CaiB-like acyl-CoA transferase
MVRVSGYGQTGPYRDKTGFGSVGEAMSGFRYLTGEPDRPPVRAGISIGDSLAATHGFIGAMLALYTRDRSGGSGRGQMVDVAIYEALWAYMESIAVLEYQACPDIAGVLPRGVSEPVAKLERRLRGFAGGVPATPGGG